MMRRRAERGFTLIELIVALALTAAILVLLFSGISLAEGPMAFTVSMPQPSSHIYHVTFRCEGLQGIRDHGEFARVRADRLRFHVFQTGGANWLLLPLKTTGTCASRATPSARRSIA